MQWIQWAIDHWEIVTGLAVAALSLINALTSHYDEHGGLRRFLALAIDLLAVLKSKGAAVGPGAPRGLPVKLPLVQLSPKRPTVNADRIQALHAAASEMGWELRGERQPLPSLPPTR